MLKYFRNSISEKNTKVYQCRSMVVLLKWEQLLQRLVGSRVKANCLHVGPGPAGEVLSMGVFIRGF